MNSPLHYAAILSVAVASAVWSTSAIYAEDGVDVPGEHAREALDKTQDAANKGIKSTADLSRQQVNQTVDDKTSMDIRSRLASIINNAVSHNGFDDLIGSLDKPTRDRIDVERFKEFDKLNASIDQFRKDFHDRYNVDFDFKSDMLDNIPIYRGPDKDHARVSLTDLHWRSNKDTGSDKDTEQSDIHDAKPRQNAALTDDPSNRKNQDTLTNNPAGAAPADKADANGSLAQGGLPDATVTGAGVANHDIEVNTNNQGIKNNNPNGTAAMPTELSLITEGVVGNGWRLQAPATLSARQLSDALSTELATLSGAKDRWPSDVNQAYLKVAKHVFRTIENAPPSNVTVENR